jgi:hypothetical protein
VKLGYKTEDNDNDIHLAIRDSTGATRWLLRFLEEDPHATIEEASLAGASLIALTGVAHEEAAQTLRAMAERATTGGTEGGHDDGGTAEG